MKPLKSFFSFSRGEQSGIVIFVALIFAFIAVNIFVREKTIKPIEKEQLELYEMEVREFQAAQKMLEIQNDSIKIARQQRQNFQNDFQQKQRAEFSFEKNASEKKYPDPFEFNPNIASKNNFIKLGFSEKQAESIIKYREKGAVFKTKKDFEKVFVVSDEMYAHLEEWITLPLDKTTETSNKEEVEEIPVVVELNSSDTIILKKIKGIGSILAKKIISYREKLGGFYAIAQLRDINGIDEERFAQIAPFLTVDIGRIKKLDLNKATFKEFTQHPYFEHYIVKSLFEFKNKNGRFESVEALHKLPLIYDDLYNKISPYLYISN